MPASTSGLTRSETGACQLGSHLLQALQLVGGLDVEAVHAHFQGAAHVIAALANAGENDLFWFATGGQYALQFTAGNDVEASAEAGQDIQHAEVGVGFDGKAHQVLDALQGVGIGTVLGLDVGARVNVGRRAEALGNGGQGHAFREQLAVAAGKSLHGNPRNQ